MTTQPSQAVTIYLLLTSTDIIILAFYFPFTFLTPRRATYLLSYRRDRRRFSPGHEREKEGGERGEPEPVVRCTYTSRRT